MRQIKTTKRWKLPIANLHQFPHFDQYTTDPKHFLSILEDVFLSGRRNRGKLVELKTPNCGHRRFALTHSETLTSRQFLVSETWHRVKFCCCTLYVALFFFFFFCCCILSVTLFFFCCYILSVTLFLLLHSICNTFFCCYILSVTLFCCYILTITPFFV